MWFKYILWYIKFMVRLTELNPKFWSEPSKQRGLGLIFRCPCRPGCTFLIPVAFKNPVGGGEPCNDEHLWQREGETFETLTLSPSIDASKMGHWHGWIKNGEVQ